MSVTSIAQPEQNSTTLVLKKQQKKMKVLYLCIVITIFLYGANSTNSTPPKNCKLSSWTSWCGCTHRCGNVGVQSRTRSKIEQECCGGKCWPLNQTKECNRDACQNGGTPVHGRCSCTAGYTGICCEIGKFERRHL